MIKSSLDSVSEALISREWQMIVWAEILADRIVEIEKATLRKVMAALKCFFTFKKITATEVMTLIWDL